MPAESSDDDKYIRRALEITIHIALVALLVGACLVILRPFVPLILWGIIIAISVYPGFKKLQRLIGGSGNIAAVACTLLMLAVLLVPVVLLGETVVEGTQAVIAYLQKGTLTIPPPPPNLESWFLIGPSLNKVWSAAANDLSSLLKMLAPQIRAIIPELLSASTGIGVTVLQFVLSILVAGVLLATAQTGAVVSGALANRIFGDRGLEFEELVGSTIRSVTTGIVGVAVIQSIFATLGFLFVGLPAVGLWGLVFLFAAVMQVGFIVLIPAVIYVFATASTTKLLLFAIWCAIVGLMDNVLKPLLLGRGVAVPIATIFLGAIGGFVAMGVIGLFLGAILLSVGYKLFLAWLYTESEDQRLQLVRKTI